MRADTSDMHTQQQKMELKRMEATRRWPSQSPSQRLLPRKVRTLAEPQAGTAALTRQVSYGTKKSPHARNNVDVVMLTSCTNVRGRGEYDEESRGRYARDEEYEESRGRYARFVGVKALGE